MGSWGRERPGGCQGYKGRSLIAGFGRGLVAARDIKVVYRKQGRCWVARAERGLVVAARDIKVVYRKQGRCWVAGAGRGLMAAKDIKVVYRK